ncbi:LamG-like jellyroll fold domain-containing protein [Arthrobacter sp. R4-81]
MGNPLSSPLSAFCSVILAAGLVTAAVPAASTAAPSGNVPLMGALTAEDIASDQASSEGADVVVESATTPTEQTVAHPDGTFTRTISNEPVRMQSGNGWEDISTDLVWKDQAGVKVLAPKMVPVGVSLGAKSSTTMATLDNGRGHSIKQTWPFGPLPEPRVEGDTATYPSVLPGVDLIQIAHRTGVSQVLKIATPEAAKDPRVVAMRIQLDAQNVSVRDDGDGGLSALGKDTGAVELRTAEGQWWDSSQEGASASDPGGSGLARPFALSLGTENGKQTQVFGMDEILNTPDLKFPLFVDPDWGVIRTSYVYVDSAYPGVSYWNGQYTDATVHVGYLPSSWAPDGVSHTTRGYYQFATQPMSGKVILAARMNTALKWSSSCTATAVDSYVTGGVSPSTTWNNQPGLVAKTDSRNAAMGYSASCPAGTVGFDMGSAKNIISTVGQWTVMLRAGNEGDPLGWKRFGNDASMIVTYNTPPSTPKLTAMTGCAANCPAPGVQNGITRFGRPIFSVYASDPDGDAGGSIAVWIAVKRPDGSPVWSMERGPINVPGSGGTASWAGDWSSDPDLTTGKYFVDFQIADQAGSVSSKVRYDFSVDTNPPKAPVITPPAVFDSAHTDPAGVVGQNAYTFSLTNSDAFAIKGFVYALTRGDTAPTLAANVACDGRFNEFVVVCPADGRTATVTVGATDYTSRLTVWSFDHAGNVNTQVKSAPVSYLFNMGSTAPAPSQLLPVTTLGGASWVDIETSNHVPVATSCQGGLPADSTAPERSTVLQFSAPGHYATTVERAVDTSQSFSVSGWFCPTTPVTTGIQAMLTQMAGTGSQGSALWLNPGGFVEFNTWTGANGAGREFVQKPEALPANKWTFVSAVYDRINRQLRITSTTTGFTATWTTAITSGTHIASPSTQPVLLGAAAAGGSGQFKGQILNPVMTQAVLTKEQFTLAQDSFKDAAGNKTTGVLK